MSKVSGSAIIKTPKAIEELIAKSKAAKLQRDAAIKYSVFITDLPIPAAKAKAAQKKQENIEKKLRMEEAKKRIKDDKEKWNESTSSKKPALAPPKEKLINQQKESVLKKEPKKTASKSSKNLQLTFTGPETQSENVSSFIPDLPTPAPQGKAAQKKLRLEEARKRIQSDKERWNESTSSKMPAKKPVTKSVATISEKPKNHQKEPAAKSDSRKTSSKSSKNLQQTLHVPKTQSIAENVTRTPSSNSSSQKDSNCSLDPRSNSTVNDKKTSSKKTVLHREKDLSRKTSNLMSQPKEQILKKVATLPSMPSLHSPVKKPSPMKALTLPSMPSLLSPVKKPSPMKALTLPSMPSLLSPVSQPAQKTQTSNPPKRSLFSPIDDSPKKIQSSRPKAKSIFSPDSSFEEVPTDSLNTEQIQDERLKRQVDMFMTKIDATVRGEEYTAMNFSGMVEHHHDYVIANGNKRKPIDSLHNGSKRQKFTDQLEETFKQCLNNNMSKLKNVNFKKPTVHTDSSFSKETDKIDHNDAEARKILRDRLLEELNVSSSSEEESNSSTSPIKVRDESENNTVQDVKDYSSFMPLTPVSPIRDSTPKLVPSCIVSISLDRIKNEEFKKPFTVPRPPKTSSHSDSSKVLSDNSSRSYKDSSHGRSESSRSLSRKFSRPDQDLNRRKVESSTFESSKDCNARSSRSDKTEKSCVQSSGSSRVWNNRSSRDISKTSSRPSKYVSKSLGSSRDLKSTGFSKDIISIASGSSDEVNRTSSKSLRNNNNNNSGFLADVYRQDLQDEKIEEKGSKNKVSGSLRDKKRSSQPSRDVNRNRLGSSTEVNSKSFKHDRKDFESPSGFVVTPIFTPIRESSPESTSSKCVRNRLLRLGFDCMFSDYGRGLNIKNGKHTYCNFSVPDSEFENKENETEN